MKRTLVMALIGALTLSITGMAEEAKAGKIGFSIITLGSDYFSNLNDDVHELLEAEGYEVVTTSCELSAATQVTDIENLISMGCDKIYFFAMDPEALTDVLKKGREEGIEMIGIATEISDPEAYDAIMTLDQYGTGAGAAQLMADWVDATFPDAEDGSIQIAAIVDTSTSENTKRSEGLQTVAELNSKIELVEVYDAAGAADPNVKSQEYAEMAMGQYPDLKGFVTFGCDNSLGINEVYMRDASLNRSEFAIFGVDTSQVVYELITASIEDEALIRGHISLGDMATEMVKFENGEFDNAKDENNMVYMSYEFVTTENVDTYIE